MSIHKVTCGVRVDVLEGVVAAIAADLSAAGVAHRLVVSGSGDWRFVDLVPSEAGKLQVGRRAGGGGRQEEAAEHGSAGLRPARSTGSALLAVLPWRPTFPRALPCPCACLRCQALEYARRKLGFTPENTVAAGDSGNGEQGGLGASCCPSHPLNCTAPVVWPWW